MHSRVSQSVFVQPISPQSSMLATSPIEKTCKTLSSWTSEKRMKSIISLPCLSISIPPPGACREVVHVVVALVVVALASKNPSFVAIPSHAFEARIQFQCAHKKALNVVNAVDISSSVHVEVALEDPLLEVVWPHLFLRLRHLAGRWLHGGDTLSSAVSSARRAVGTSAAAESRRHGASTSNR